jgi:hypothetical protein
MPSESIIIYAQELDRADHNIIQLLDFLGIRYRTISLSNSSFDFDSLCQQLEETDACILVNCKTLGILLRDAKQIDSFRDFVGQQLSSMLVYNITPADHDIAVLNGLTGGHIQSVSSFNDNHYQYRISQESNICRQFSGLAFGPINHDTDYKFILTDSSENSSNLIDIDGCPFFMKMDIGGCSAFFIASDQILDIRQKVTEEININEIFSRIVPEIMFLKFNFRATHWHQNKRLACLIIEDPYLKEQYGFLNFRRLLEEMDKHNFSTSIAFIPWNYKRTDRNISELFKARPDRFSICVHGCDHTDSEFGTQDVNELNSMINLATNRMDYHESVTGLKHDRVFMFPQGNFSTTALQLLKSNNYIAAVNGDAFPINGSDGFEFLHFLEPAIMTYHGFPFFFRRAPDKPLSSFAFDLLMGKPVLIGTHHSFLRGGYQELTDLIDAINSLDENICWDGLENIFERSILQRQENDSMTNLKVYANKVVIENTSDRAHGFTVSKREMGNVSVKSILINGNPIPYETSNGTVKFSWELQPKTRVVSEYTYQNKYHLVEQKRGTWKAWNIAKRRYLSDIRDNLISKNESLLQFAETIKNKL